MDRLFLYSKTILSFLDKLTLMIKTVLNDEMNLTVRRKRFEYKNRLYPIHPVVFERNQVLAYFDYQHFQLGFHKTYLLIQRTRFKKYCPT